MQEWLGRCQGSEGAHGHSAAELGQAAWHPRASQPHWGRPGVAFVSKDRGQQSSVTCVQSVPAVVWQRSKANVPAELGIFLRPSAPSSNTAAAPLSSQHWGSCSPWAGGKRATRYEALTKYLLVQTDLPFFRQLLKMKIPPRSLFTEMPSRLDEIFLRVGYLSVLWKASIKLQQVQYFKMFFNAL